MEADRKHYDRFRRWERGVFAIDCIVESKRSWLELGWMAGARRSFEWKRLKTGKLRAGKRLGWCGWLDGSSMGGCGMGLVPGGAEFLRFMG
jgi:hypothetical protein